MLHGFLGSGRNLGALVRAWSKMDPDLRFVQADLLGHGKSPPIPEGADLTTMAEAGLALLRQVAPEQQVWVVGHSIGGRVGLMMRDLEPQTVGRLSLLDIAPGPTRGLPTTRIVDALMQAPERAESRAVYAHFFEERGLGSSLTAWLLMNLEHDEGDYTWRIDRDALVRFHVRSGGEDMWAIAAEHAEAIDCQIGGASQYVRAPDMAHFSELGIPLHTIAGAGHFIHVDAPDEVIEYLKDSGGPWKN